MKNICLLDDMQHTIRSEVCTICQFRPEGSEKLGPDVPRDCERKCSIMKNLAKLDELAGRVDAVRDLDQQIIDGICQTCESSPTAGDFCTRRFTQVCPMSVHGTQALDALIALHRPTSVAKRL